MITNGTIGVVFGCTDPRLYSATYLIERYQQALDVTTIIPLFRPGIVGLYVKPGVVGEPFHPHGRRERDTNDARRIAIERELDIHMGAHGPTVALLVAHSDCKGYPKGDLEQRENVVFAAANLRQRLHRATRFSGDVLPAMLSHGPKRDWVLELLPALQSSEPERLHAIG